MGGGGGSQITAHVHTNSAGQGGSLDNTTLLEQTALVPKTPMHVIETHEATTTESSFVFSFSAIDFDDDSYLILEFDGATSASLDLQLRFNTNATANYYTDGSVMVGGVQTLIDLNTQTAGRIMNTVSARGCFCFVKIFLIKAGSVNSVMYRSNGYFDGLPTSENESGQLFNQQIASLTSVEVRTSTSTWTADTRITLYRVKRS